MTTRAIRHTKLVCTIGQASVHRVGELVEAGMDVARINFSHGTPGDHAQYVRAVREAADERDRPVAVVVDVPGPKIRLGEFESGRSSYGPAGPSASAAEATRRATPQGRPFPIPALPQICALAIGSCLPTVRQSFAW